MNIRFIKLSGRWFVDIPWDGNIEDLQMVCGADLLLDNISENNFYVDVNVSTNDENGEITLHKIKEDDFSTGCYYKVNSFQFKGEIWLCNVTKHVFGEFPNIITFNII